MKVCYFGNYDSEYIRNKVIITGLKANGVSVIECVDRSPGIRKFVNLFRKHWKIRNEYDIMIVGFSGQLIVPFAWILCRKKIVFDGFVPIYDALIYNHKSVKKHSLKSVFYWLLDFFAVHLSDLVLTDTNEHVNYYAKTFKAKKKKFNRLFIGANTDIFMPLERKRHNKDFIIEFHAIVYGEHGIDDILDAAKILKSKNFDIKFLMIGASRMYDQAKERAKHENLDNMEFVGRKPLKDIARYIAESDVCLGLFGKTEKVQRVIPNKAYEIIACDRPLVSVCSRAMKELFKNRETCMFTNLDNGESLADAIIELKSNDKLRKKISENGYQLFINNLTPKKIGENLISILSK
jgi:glycosyltransferase involved in cell wall biosynthesis